MKLMLQETMMEQNKVVFFQDFQRVHALDTNVCQTNVRLEYSKSGALTAIPSTPKVHKDVGSVLLLFFSTHDIVVKY